MNKLNNGVKISRVFIVLVLIITREVFGKYWPIVAVSIFAFSVGYLLYYEPNSKFIEWIKKRLKIRTISGKKSIESGAEQSEKQSINSTFKSFTFSEKCLIIFFLYKTLMSFIGHNEINSLAYIAVVILLYFLFSKAFAKKEPILSDNAVYKLKSINNDCPTVVLTINNAIDIDVHSLYKKLYENEWYFNHNNEDKVYRVFPPNLDIKVQIRRNFKEGKFQYNIYYEKHLLGYIQSTELEDNERYNNEPIISMKIGIYLNKINGYSAYLFIYC